MLLSAAILAAILVGVCSCKAWRTVTTTATYVQQNDSAKVSQTITTKTVEEYQGVKKR
jgi:chitodextrinase